MLDTLDAWLEEFPPLANAQRFGNKAFRSWAEKLREVKKLLRARACMHCFPPCVCILKSFC